MGEDVEKVLQNMEGKDVNIYQVGKITSYRLYENFSFFIQECITGDYLVFTSQYDEVRFSILMDEIYDIKIEKDGSEIIFILNETGNIQVWIDVIE